MRQAKSHKPRSNFPTRTVLTDTPSTQRLRASIYFRWCGGRKVKRFAAATERDCRAVIIVANSPAFTGRLPHHGLLAGIRASGVFYAIGRKNGRSDASIQGKGLPPIGKCNKSPPRYIMDNIRKTSYKYCNQIPDRRNHRWQKQQNSTIG